MPLIPGGVIKDRYRIEYPLPAQGGMSAVYCAMDMRLNVPCAVKEMAPYLHIGERALAQLREQFFQEAKVLAELHHPNLPRVIDHFEYEGNVYLVMDFVEGERLDELIAKDKTISLDTILLWAQELMDALSYCHAQRVIHRDVKPQNVIITPQGRAVLVDFGLVKVLDPDDRRTRTVMRGLGTPEYAPPEQYDAETGSTDARTDVYSLAATLYHALTGMPPPTATQRIVNPSLLKSVRHHQKAISPHVDAAISKAMSLQPYQRFPTMVHMAAALLEQPFAKPSRTPFVSHVARPINNLMQTVRLSITSMRGIPRQRLWLPLMVGAIIVLVVFSPLRDSLMWVSAVKWLGIVLALVATGAALVRVAPVAIDSGRVIAGTVSRLGNAIQQRRTRLARPNSTVHHLSSPLEIPTFQPSTDRPTMRLKPEFTGWVSYSKQHIIEDLIMHEAFERLKSFIVGSEGGRFVLTGYGRFGGTSLVKSAMNRARRELRKKGLSDAALLVFYFDVSESNGRTRKFEIKANEFSFGRLTTQRAEGVDGSGLEALKAHADRTESFSDTSPFPLTCHFSLTTPLGKSFFNRSGLTVMLSRKSATRDLDFSKLVAEFDDFFTKDKSNTDLQKIVLQLIGSKILPARVVIILDKISRLETLEDLAQLELFRNERITVIVVTRKEDFDQWENYERRLRRIEFKKWYVPCLWHGEPGFARQINQTLLEPLGLQGSEAEDVVSDLRKHLEFIGRGAVGDALEELKHPQYWSSDEKGNLYLRLDALPHPDNIQHSAWMQDVLNLNWSVILAGLFAGKDLDEREDRTRIGVYYLLDWIARQQIFVKGQLLKASHTTPITISDNLYVADEIIQNLLHVLEQNRYLRLINGQYRVTWDKSVPLLPQEVSIRVSTTPLESKEPPIPLPGEVASEKMEQDQPVVLPAANVTDLENRKVFRISESEGGTRKEWEFAVEESGDLSGKRTSTRKGTEMKDETKILVVFANPKGSDPLRLGEEDRIIRECVERSKNRDSLHYEIRHAVRVKDVQRAMLKDDYHIIHFSGHAAPSGNLAFEDETGNPKLIPQQALADLLSNFVSIECVILNACYSVSQGQLVSLDVPFTIAMAGPISDDAAKHFTRGFYDTIGAGRDYRFAYRMGCNTIAMEGYAEESTPQLLEK